MYLKKGFLRILLYPFAVIYGWIIRLRNWLYDRRIAPSKSYTMPIIGIGNLSSGGTGKTPMAEYVLKLLSEHNHNPALLSRGYSRKTKGFLLVKPHSTAAHVGDEPFQIKKKFPTLTVAVCEDRVAGVDMIREIAPQTDVIVLDDSFQHRRLQTGFTILLTDYYKPFYEDEMLPAGRLRESAEGKKRADIIIMTKCPQYPEPKEKSELLRKIAPLPGQEVFFSSLGYCSVMAARLEPEEPDAHPVQYLKGYSVVVFSGIAYPEPLEMFLQSLCAKVVPLRFADHHDYTDPDIKKITDTYLRLPDRNKLLLTTEKDWRRLQGTPQVQKLLKLPLFFLPVAVQFQLDEKSRFEQLILNYVKQPQRNDQLDTQEDEFPTQNGDYSGDGLGWSGEGDRSGSYV